jgi:hypothetical protein
MTKSAPDGPPIRRIDRILAYMSIGLVVLAILSFFAVLIGSGAGADFESGVWPVIRILPIIALPVGFVLLLTLLIMSFRRRGRENKA